MDEFSTNNDELITGTSISAAEATTTTASSFTSSRQPSRTDLTADCVQWSNSLSTLLHSAEGTVLFLKFLEVEETYHAKLLKFWLAVEGFRLQSNKKLTAQYLLKYFPKLPIENEERKLILRQSKEFAETDDRLVHIFDDAQSKVEELINRTTYPNFLSSELYVNYVQDNSILDEYETEISSTADSPPVNYSEPEETTTRMTPASYNLIPNFNSFLQTVHEDCELQTTRTTTAQPSSTTASLAPVTTTATETAVAAATPTSTMTSSYPGSSHQPENHNAADSSSGHGQLSQQMLLESQNNRAESIRCRSEEYFCNKRSMNLSSSVSYHMNNRYNSYPKQPHAVYNSFNPVSCRNSDTQSVYSHSDSDTQSVISRFSCASESSNVVKTQSPFEEITFLNEKIILNHNAKLEGSINTHRATEMHKKNLAEQRAGVKLVRNEEEFVKCISRKLSEIDQGTKKISVDDIMEKLNAVTFEENSQDILEKHISRVFPESSSSSSNHIGKPLRNSTSAGNRRAASQLSVDSGNDCLTTTSSIQSLPILSSSSSSAVMMVRGNSHRMTTMSTISAPAASAAYGNRYGHSASEDEQQRRQSLQYDSSASVAAASSPMLFHSNKRLNGSGSGSAVVGHPQKPHTFSSSLLSASSMFDSGIICNGSSSGGEMSSSSTASNLSLSSASLSPASVASYEHYQKQQQQQQQYIYQQQKQRMMAAAASNSTSAIQATTGVSHHHQNYQQQQLQQQQKSFRKVVSTASLPPVGTSNTLRFGSNDSSYQTLPQPPPPPHQHHHQQLQLQPQHYHQLCSTASMTSIATTITSSMSGASTCGGPNAADNIDCLIRFSDEECPYRIRIKDSQLTLRQFKEQLPKKGLYRYFFKTYCDELESVFFNEVVHDDECIPTFKGKVVCKITETAANAAAAAASATINQQTAIFVSKK